MASETIRVLSADCTVTIDATDRQEYRGQVLALVKPDNTVLIHDDASGYQPVAWLTRADGVMADRDGAGRASPRRTEGRAAAAKLRRPRGRETTRANTPRDRRRGAGRPSVRTATAVSVHVGRGLLSLLW
ncbi:MAG: endonuclease NucS [Natrialbaceae archaeon]|nr:endonuclease NucS [Natrialbaceae archaeon]